MQPKSNKRKIFILLGPTSSGKTSLALKLCKDLNGEIISCDSRQVVKSMDIGTGKLPINTDVSIEKHDKYWQIDNINIWGYDLVTPLDYFSVYDFADFALNKIDEITDKNIFCVGGTGLYIDVLTGNIKLENGAPNFELRKELETLTLEELQKKLSIISSLDYAKVDLNNPHRLIRAIEKHYTSVPKELPYCADCDFIYLGLHGSRELLYKRADIWAETIWPYLIQETQTLLGSPYKSSLKLRGFIYKEACDFIENKLTETEAITKIKYALHAYIRRQETYFKKMDRTLAIKWFDISSSSLYSNIREYLT